MINDIVVLFGVKFEGSALRYANKYTAERMVQTADDINKFFQRKDPVPLITFIKDLLFNGLTNMIKAARPAMKGISITASPKYGSSPRGLRSFGFADNSAATSGFSAALILRIMKRGIAPIVFETARTAISIIKYLQKEFFPLNDDSRCFIQWRFFRIP